MIPTDGAEGFIGWHTVVQVGGIEGKCGGQLAGEGRETKFRGGVLCVSFEESYRVSWKTIFRLSALFRALHFPVFVSRNVLFVQSTCFFEIGNCRPGKIMLLAIFISFGGTKIKDRLAPHGARCRVDVHSCVNTWVGIIDRLIFERPWMVALCTLWAR